MLCESCKLLTICAIYQTYGEIIVPQSCTMYQTDNSAISSHNAKHDRQSIIDALNKKHKDALSDKQKYECELCHKEYLIEEMTTCSQCNKHICINCATTDTLNNIVVCDKCYSN